MKAKYIALSAPTRPKKTPGGIKGIKAILFSTSYNVYICADLVTPCNGHVYLLFLHALNRSTMQHYNHELGNAYYGKKHFASNVDNREREILCLSYINYVCTIIFFSDD